MIGQKGSPDSRRRLSNQTSKPAPVRLALQPLDCLEILACIANENRGGLAIAGIVPASDVPAYGLIGKGSPFLGELVHEVDGICHTEGSGLRTEVLQKVAQMDVRHDCSIGDKFASLVATVETIRR